MELKSLTREGLLTATARQFGLTSVDMSSEELPAALIASALRRIAAITCPCPRDALIGRAVDAFSGLSVTEAIRLRVREILDSLIVIGDLLELGGPTYLPGVIAQDWLYCAPPTFVVRDGSVLLLGIEPEDQSSMPATLRARVSRQRELRYIRTDGDQDSDGIATQLRIAGYMEISRLAWTRPPLNQDVDVFLEGVVRRLIEADNSGALEGLQVYGAANPAHRFTSRLMSPAGCSGFYVGRRPQAFGASIWVFVELKQGRPVRFLDLPWRGGKFRGCDQGWRIQSALDARTGRPQIYRVTPINDDIDRYEFFSPLPLWIERKLRIDGERVPANGALFAYALDRRCARNIDDLVQSYMWLQKVD